MITEAILNPIYSILQLFISFLPVIGDLPTWVDNAFNLLSYILMFFPVDVFVAIIGNVGLWMGANFIWSIIEWIYKKLPGID